MQFSESPSINFEGNEDRTHLLNFRKLIEDAKTYDQFFVARNTNGDIINIKEYKVSSMLIDTLPEEMKPKLRSVIKLGFRLKLEKDPSVPANMWNKKDNKYSKIIVLNQFPDIVEEDAFQFKYRNPSMELVDCLPISEWIMDVPYVAPISSSSSASDHYNTPPNSAVKKARTNEDL